MKTETYMGKGRERNCDLCERNGIKKEACYDAKIEGGSWAYVCAMCFGLSNGKLGTGLGQRLIYEDKPVVLNKTQSDAGEAKLEVAP